MPSGHIAEVIFSPRHSQKTDAPHFNKANHSTPRGSTHPSDHRLLTFASLSYTSSFQGLCSFILTHTREIDLEIMNTFGQLLSCNPWRSTNLFLAERTYIFLLTTCLPFTETNRAKHSPTPSAYAEVQRHLYACFRATLHESKVPNNTQG